MPDFSQNLITQSVGLASGGTAPGGVTDVTEEYNGSTWYERGNLINGRYGAAGGGTTCAAWIAGGYDSPTNVTCTELYGGAGWVASAALSTAAVYMAGFGTVNSAVAFGGFAERRSK